MRWTKKVLKSVRACYPNYTLTDDDVEMIYQLKELIVIKTYEKVKTQDDFHHALNVMMRYFRIKTRIKKDSKLYFK